MRSWYLFAAAGVALLLLVWGLHAEQGQAEPAPLVPYMLVAIPTLLAAGVTVSIRSRRRVRASA
jgi:hypothetical protein